MRRLRALWTCLALMALPPSAHARDALVVLTQNQYLGADLTPLGAAFPDPVAINTAVLALLAQIQANNFPERAQAMAQEIAAHRPEVVGLQEVFTFTLNGSTGAPPYRDHLADTLHALDALGAPYQVAASVQAMQLAIPVDFDGDGQPEAMVEVTERDVLLVRQEMAFRTVPFSQFCARPAPDGAGGCNYQVVLEHPATHIKIERGFAGADIAVGARRYRVVTTHLEEREPDPTNPLSAAIQAAQAAELLGLLRATPTELSIIVLGDMNSSPNDRPFDQLIPPYLQFIDAGFRDVWSLRPGNAPGWTCCQAADLRNQRSLLSERIDLLFTDFQPRKVKARLVGNRVADQTRPDRLWPSDHAGVVAALTVD